LILPSAATGKPWNTVCGHIVALAVALLVHSLQLPLFWEKILAPAFAVSAMLYLQVR
jgi:CBS-domain-containing membrane protein